MPIEKVTVDRPEITGAEILALVRKTPAQFKLYEHRRHHQPKPIQPDETCLLVVVSGWKVPIINDQPARWTIAQRLPRQT